MIPEQYWRLARRWYWLVATCGVLGAVAGYLFLPSFIGTGASYNSTATLAVSQYIPVARAVDDSSLSADATVLAAYTDAMAAYADTPHYHTEVQALLAADGSPPSITTIDRMLSVSANSHLFRLTIEVKADSADLAEAVASAASGALIAHAAGEESRLSTTLAANLEAQRDELILRLQKLAADKTAGIGDIDAEDLEAGVIRSEIEDVTAQIERLHLGEEISLPLVTAGPPRTVHYDGAALSPRDVLLLGAVGGLVAGWGAANLAERMTAREQATRREPAPEAMAIAPAVQRRPPLDVAVQPTNSGRSELALLRLAERAAAVERRARQLDESMANGARPAGLHAHPTNN